MNFIRGQVKSYYCPPWELVHQNWGHLHRRKHHQEMEDLRRQVVMPNQEMKESRDWALNWKAQVLGESELFHHW
jgi:hypothetical protein